MKDKKFIITITEEGKPVFATQSRIFAGCALLGERGPVQGLFLGNATEIEMAVMVAALYRLCEETEKKHGHAFKKLVKKARKAEKVESND